MKFKKILFLLPFALLLTACGNNGGNQRNYCYITFYDGDVHYDFVVRKGETIDENLYNNFKIFKDGNVEIQKIENDTVDWGDLSNLKVNKFKEWKSDDNKFYTTQGTKTLFSTPFYKDTNMKPQYNSYEGVCYTFSLKNLQGEAGQEEPKYIGVPYYKAFRKNATITQQEFNEAPFYNQGHQKDIHTANNCLTSYTVYNQDEDLTIKGRYVLKGLFTKQGENVIGSVATNPKEFEATYSPLQTTYDLIYRDIVSDVDIPIAQSSTTLIEDELRVAKTYETKKDIGYNDKVELESEYSEYLTKDFNKIHTFSGWFRSYDTLYLGEYESSSNPYNFVFEPRTLNSYKEESDKETIYLNALYTPNANKYKFYSYIDEKTGATVETNYILKGDVELIGEIRIPNSIDLRENEEVKEVTGIIDEGFMDTNLGKININNSIEEIISNESVEWNSTIEYIGDDAFANCFYLSEMEIPYFSSPELYLGETVFRGCPNIKTFSIKNVIGEDKDEEELKNRTIYIYDGSLYSANGNNLTLYRHNKCEGDDPAINGTTKFIGDYAFNDDGGFKKITIPSSVEDIGKYAFSGCYNLMELDLSQDTEHEIPYYYDSGESKMFLFGTMIEQTSSFIQPEEQWTCWIDINEVNRQFYITDGAKHGWFWLRNIKVKS